MLLFTFHRFVVRRLLPSFPTRRSSDLAIWEANHGPTPRGKLVLAGTGWATATPSGTRLASAVAQPRSEEHTSEIQSRPQIVCRLLLEKKDQNSAPNYAFV